MKRREVLANADQIVSCDRNVQHGEPEENFARIAAKWSITLGVKVTAAQVALCMIDFKTCRAIHNTGNVENWTDIVGYAACGAEVADAS